MERIIISIALFSCLVAGTTLYSCCKGSKEEGYTTADFEAYTKRQTITK